MGVRNHCYKWSAGSSDVAVGDAHIRTTDTHSSAWNFCRFEASKPKGKRDAATSFNSLNRTGRNCDAGYCQARGQMPNSPPNPPTRSGLFDLFRAPTWLLHRRLMRMDERPVRFKSEGEEGKRVIIEAHPARGVATFSSRPPSNEPIGFRNRTRAVRQRTTRSSQSQSHSHSSHPTLQ